MTMSERIRMIKYMYCNRQKNAERAFMISGETSRNTIWKALRRNKRYGKICEKSLVLLRYLGISFRINILTAKHHHINFHVDIF